jgi:hypothetical protein
MLAIRELYLANSASCSDSEPRGLCGAGPAVSPFEVFDFAERGLFAAGSGATD